LMRRGVVVDRCTSTLGGLGLVFMAEQQKSVRRKVAVEVLKPFILWSATGAESRSGRPDPEQKKWGDVVEIDGLV
jgi:hypothetical protein